MKLTEWCSVPTAPVLGVPSNQISKNVGTMENTGYEFSADYSIINKADLRWNVGFTTFQNLVTSLPGGSDLVGGSSEPTITQTLLLEKMSRQTLFWIRILGR
jgi:hypothetical protein